MEYDIEKYVWNSNNFTLLSKNQFIFLSQIAPQSLKIIYVIL